MPVGTQRFMDDDSIFLLANGAGGTLLMNHFKKRYVIP
jgi:hypothetical protein